ncbi:restriction endonuclease [Prescottella equi]|uniref:restriction endonuclease n=1 Tax=Rhodococcus hoagii TaxID=43767 RepID=UPI000A102D9D|nr:restriction endonuclease [Prescottella equi]
MTVSNAIRGVVDSILSADAPATIRVRALFADHLAKEGFSDLSAEEAAEKNLSRLMSELQRRIDDWEDRGIPSPVYAGDNPSFYYSVRSKKYLGELNAGFWDFKSMVDSASSATLDLLGAAYLTSVGCDRVFVTDGKNDGGVDVIGRLKIGHGLWVIVALQCKAYSSPIGRVEFDKEVGRFKQGTGEPVWEKYQRMLSISSLKGAATRIYCMLTSTGFSPEIEIANSDRYFAAISPAALCHQLSTKFRYDGIVSRISEVLDDTTDHRNIEISGIFTDGSLKQDHASA